MDHDGPLSESELDELDELLLDAAMPEECMDLSMLDGFLTALAIGPSEIPPETWLPQVWGGTPGLPAAQQKRLEQLIFRHSFALREFLRTDVKNFEPLLFDAPEEDGGGVVAEAWCGGFVHGMTLDDATWQTLLDHEAGTCLDTIVLLGSEEGEAAQAEEPLSREEYEARVADLSKDVTSIRAWWLPKRHAASTVRHTTEPVGRNEPCPCGSGKKYKKCCGAS